MNKEVVSIAFDQFLKNKNINQDHRKNHHKPSLVFLYAGKDSNTKNK